MKDEQSAEQTVDEITKRCIEAALSDPTVVADPDNWAALCRAVDPEWDELCERIDWTDDICRLRNLIEHAAFALGVAVGKRLK